MTFCASSLLPEVFLRLWKWTMSDGFSTTQRLPRADERECVKRLWPDAPGRPGYEIRLTLLCADIGSKVDGKKPLERTGTVQQSLHFFSHGDLSIDRPHRLVGGSPSAGAGFSKNRYDKPRMAGGSCSCPGPLWICAVGLHCGAVQPAKRLIIFKLPVLRLPGRPAAGLRRGRKPPYCFRPRRQAVHERVFTLGFQRRYPTSALQTN